MLSRLDKKTQQAEEPVIATLMYVDVKSISGSGYVLIPLLNSCKSAATVANNRASAGQCNSQPIDWFCQMYGQRCQVGSKVAAESAPVTSSGASGAGPMRTKRAGKL